MVLPFFFLPSVWSLLHTFPINPSTGLARRPPRIIHLLSFNRNLQIICTILSIKFNFSDKQKVAHWIPIRIQCRRQVIYFYIVYCVASTRQLNVEQRRTLRGSSRWVVDIIINTVCYFWARIIIKANKNKTTRVVFVWGRNVRHWVTDH